MGTKFQKFLQLALRSPKRFPVEAALGVIFFILSVLFLEYPTTDKMNIGEKLLYFIPLVSISFWLQSINKKAYLASFFLIVPLLYVDVAPYIETFGFVFTYVLAALLLIVGDRIMDNRSFVAHAIHVCTQMFLGVLIVGIFTLVVMTIIYSYDYIFELSPLVEVYVYSLFFIWFVVAPQVCCTLIRQDEDKENEPAKTMRIILNYVLSPAVIIYTVILYVYFLKIVCTWELPKGGVAWMVMGFITVALAGRVSQSVLSKRYFDWFYNRLTWIAIPPLILYWVGTIYRIQMYSFTESRFYLFIVGVLMTLFVLMLAKEHTRKYQLMVFILGSAIILFTYIPGVSAKSIGLACQKHRMNKFISELNLMNMKTGKLKVVDYYAVRKDSIARENLKEFCDVVQYVKGDMGDEDFYMQYGSWSYSARDFE